MTRIKAFAIHFAISASVVLTVAIILSLTWYPPAYALAMGGLGLMGILAGVDICMGPLLTGVVWNPRKPLKKLKFDVTVIALLQVVALGYGLYTIFQARPVYLAFVVDRFEMLRAVDIPKSELQNAQRDEFKSLPLTGPKVIAVKKPEDPAEREKILFSAIAGGLDLANFPKYYVPYSELTDVVRNKAQPVERLMRQGEAIRDEVNGLLTRHGLKPDTVKFLPLTAKVRDQAVIVDAIRGDVLGIIDADPWKAGEQG